MRRVCWPEFSSALPLKGESGWGQVCLFSREQGPYLIGAMPTASVCYPMSLIACHLLVCCACLCGMYDRSWVVFLCTVCVQLVLVFSRICVVTYCSLLHAVLVTFHLSPAGSMLGAPQLSLCIYKHCVDGKASHRVCAGCEGCRAECPCCNAGAGDPLGSVALTHRPPTPAVCLCSCQRRRVRGAVLPPPAARGLRPERGAASPPRAPACRGPCVSARRRAGTGRPQAPMARPARPLLIT